MSDSLSSIAKAKLRQIFETTAKHEDDSILIGPLYHVISDLERIGDHATNIAFSILNEDSVEVKELLEKEHIDISEYHKT